MLKFQETIFWPCVNIVCWSDPTFVLQVLFPLIGGTVCVNEAKQRHVDGAITADFKGCCNDSSLVCAPTTSLLTLSVD